MAFKRFFMFIKNKGSNKMLPIKFAIFPKLLLIIDFSLIKLNLRHNNNTAIPKRIANTLIIILFIKKVMAVI